MSNVKQMFYTQEGYNELLRELDVLKNVKRPQNKKDIATARGFGDLSENSEYEEARNEQAKIESRITELEAMLAAAKVIDESQIDTDRVFVGASVKVRNETTGADMTLEIVSSNEADPAKLRISDQSPIGGALVGKKIGESVKITTPGGELHLTVVNITRE